MKINKTVPAISVLLGSILVAGCDKTSPLSDSTTGNLTPSTELVQQEAKHVATHSKPVVYQVFTRLFGNTNQANKPWGTKAENGVGTFADFTPKALAEIKALGVTHIWYTGVLHHALVADYSEIGIENDDPDVIKGRAGSPYAIKDYYNVNPDLAVVPKNRLAEFEALIERTHAAGMKVIIDIVPNHVARNYQSSIKIDGVSNFGSHDNTSLEYARDNNFYYVVGEDFKVPKDNQAWVLGGEAHPLADGHFVESPAKWTGNGARAAQPHSHDWYETVKVNYGVKPDGSYDFASLPDAYAEKDTEAHFQFWQEKQHPDSWYKFEHIVHYWLDKGVDGFRYDMAEMVPVEFWSFLNSSIKHKNPNAFLLAEVYNPNLYRPYLQLGKMDYLYDKVGFYDSLKTVMQGKADASQALQAHLSVQDIAPSMLHFLENHDEQRIASPEFVGDANIGKPAMVVSHFISTSPTMIYFGQTVGEDGSEHAGFGQPSRTSIFDYVGVPAHQAWMNEGKFDGAKLSTSQRSLRQYYQTLLNLNTHPAVALGEYISIPHAYKTGVSIKPVMSFGRSYQDQNLVIASNFDAHNAHTVTLQVPSTWQGTVFDILESHPRQIIGENGKVTVTLAPLASVVYQVE